jgi:precorrin-6B methylase 2
MPARSTYHASDGAAYELFLGRWTKRLAAPLLDFAEFPPDGALLDVGTGTGSLAFAMAARWPKRETLGIDIRVGDAARGRGFESNKEKLDHDSHGLC